MIFTSYWFIAAAIILFTLYYCIGNWRLRKLILVAFCSVFEYHFAGPAGVLPIVFLGGITYLAGLSRRRLLVIPSIIIVVLALVFYKYSIFLCAELIRWIPGVASPLQTALLKAHPEVPPLAISFFAFEFVHYLVEILQGGEPIRNFPDFFLFGTFWPSLVAGPIKRYQQFVPAMNKGIRVTRWDNFSFGLMRVCVGYTKKAVVADTLTAWIRDNEAGFLALPFRMRWVFFIALAYRIYFDFSGYSDMAIGFGRMMGIKLPENFRWPYFASSIAEFWHRWHISLSSWIRDYVYIPLGGNRHGLFRKVFNGLAAFALCGLWHGAAWNFVVWGLYHGVGLALENVAKPIFRPLNERLNVLKGNLVGASLKFGLWLMGCAFLNLFVWTGWLLFFYPCDKAWQMFLGLIFP